MYGDKSFANLIADVNGYRKQDRPPPGLASVAWVKRSGTQVLLEGIARTLGLYGSQRRYV